jgi:hypothetical protein
MTTPNRSTTATRSLLAGAALLLAGLSLGAMLPQEAPPSDAARNPAAETIPEVARLAAMAGLWETQTVMGGMPPAQGLAKLNMIGGHWLIEEFSSEFMGQPFAGHGITGWDVRRKTYVSAWADSMDTALKVVDMKWDETQQALVAAPQMIDMGGGEQKMIGVTRWPDADTMVYTMTPDEPDALPAMTITYTRKR